MANCRGHVGRFLTEGRAVTTPKALLVLLAVACRYCGENTVSPSPSSSLQKRGTLLPSAPSMLARKASLWLTPDLGKKESGTTDFNL